MLTVALVIAATYGATRIFNSPAQALASVPLFGALGLVLFVLERPAMGGVAIALAFALAFAGGVGVLAGDDWTDV